LKKLPCVETRIRLSVVYTEEYKKRALSKSIVLDLRYKYR